MISAILLAAGRSRRMGAFKPLLPFGERTVIEACVCNLLEGGVEEVVVVVSGTHANELRKRLSHHPRVRFAVNLEAESEMGVSIARGVEGVSKGARAVLIALADQPAIPPSTISLLIAAGKNTEKRLIVPEYEGRGGHPVWIDLSFSRELQNLPSQRGLRALFEAHPEEALRVPVSSPYIARDMDQWDDYRALYSEVFGTEPPESSEKR
ncbi:MAG TPA: nucleotidyltransferase family protein [Pyrinomonadaceae bacterium]|nr:nucleotidyltransferase family protein [Pyrinomonadaceae bacterium]